MLKWKLWVWLSKYSILLHSPLLWGCEVIKCLRDEVKCAGWHQPCEAALGCCGPSGHIRRKNVCFGWPQDVELWRRGGLDVRNTWPQWGQDRAGGARLYHTTQHGRQCKPHELFTSRTFHLILSHQDWLWVTETTKSKTVGKEKLQLISEAYLEPFIIGIQ